MLPFSRSSSYVCFNCLSNIRLTAEAKKFAKVTHSLSDSFGGFVYLDISARLLRVHVSLKTATIVLIRFSYRCSSETTVSRLLVVLPSPFISVSLSIPACSPTRKPAYFVFDSFPECCCHGREHVDVCHQRILSILILLTVVISASPPPCSTTEYPAPS